MTYPTWQDSPDRWNGDPSVSLGFYVGELYNAIDRVIRQEVAPYGLTPIDYNLLWYCMEEERTATRLAQVLPVDGSRISRLVTGLVDRGLLRRRRLRNDRRIVMLSLTSEGFELTSRIFQNMQSHYAASVEAINREEMLVFQTVITKLLVSYKAAEKPG